MRTTRRRLAATALSALLAGGVLAAEAGAETLKGPKRVKPGSKVTFRAAGFSPGQAIPVLLQPTENRGGNGFGIAIKRQFTANDRGRARLRFRWPKRYMGCAGVNDCSAYRWKRGSRADVNAGTARKVVRIGGGAKKDRGRKKRRCGRIQFVPNSDDSLSRIVAVGMTCRAARRTLWRSRRQEVVLEAVGWRCKTVREFPGFAGAGRFRCRKAGRVLAFNYP